MTQDVLNLPAEKVSNIFHVHASTSLKMTLSAPNATDQHLLESNLA